MDQQEYRSLVQDLEQALYSPLTQQEIEAAQREIDAEEAAVTPIEGRSRIVYQTATLPPTTP